MNSTPTDTAIALVAEILERDAAEISVDAHFADDLDADSLNLVEIAAALETEFGLEFDPDHPPTSLRQALDLIPPRPE
ncbi:acyl carrier protein [Stackebrandtia soli]|uniref:acyl carrier protein n=1 Tax=Stackebrandtia soli TaxID=1892856 RepID=UPI0039EB17ED